MKQLDLIFNTVTRKARIADSDSELQNHDRVIFGDIMDSDFQVDNAQTDEQIEALADSEVENDSAMFDTESETLTVAETRGAVLVMLIAIRNRMREL